MKLLTTLITLAFALSVAASPTRRDTSICAGEEILSETYIGEEKNVRLQHITCPPTPAKRALAPRQTNVCGNTCITNCFVPSGGGPVPDDCHVIADALRFDSENVGALFEIGTGVNNTIALTYATCESFYVNQDPTTQIYCRTDWAAVIDWVAPNCQSTQNAHGGNCVATDQQFFIQVQHS
ncbi:MAG: hypothetical protein NXY57DRAFT_577529 [Lentinula lateritia]|uniref:Uncharacterized protein n=1 Tax=Lentinula lateritia TaxID=40482 RepID=A0ABQ8VJJ8_9AGAR|nr:MAG: hypothetical protein NXY57DRAFT_577529 [Lentinula lateritia]KAJ4496583.1 hypothetical protein C8R41DRAFT_263802 [Lentinula lateritia]